MSQTYYVAHDGAENASGTVEAPYRFVQDAIEAAKAAGGNSKGAVTIVLRGGLHELADTIRLDSSLSGRVGRPTVIRAEAGEIPILSGGKRIEGWTLHDEAKQIFKAPAPPFPFRQLYVNGRRAIRARIPNRDDDRTMGPYYRLLAWGHQHENQAFLRVSRDDLTGIDLDRDLDGAEVVVSRHWDQHRLRLNGAAAEDGAVLLSLREPEGSSSLKAPWPQQAPGQAYYIENSYAFLDAPGEWHLDSAANTVYYKPLPDEDIADAEVYVPRLEHLLVADGVHHFRIEGLTFEHSTWLEPDKQGYVGLQAMNYYNRGERRATAVAPAAIVFTDSSHVEFERNIVQHTGSTGLAFAGDSHHNRIRGNVIRYVAGNGLHMNLRNDRRVATHHDEISHNYIYGYGRDYHGGVGLLLSYCYETTVEHNRVFHGPYTGISVGWGWTLNETSLRDIQVRYNDVHDVAEAMDDGACLYTLSRQDGTLIFENHFHDLKRSPWAGHHPHYSLYFDQGSKNITAKRNVLHHESRDYFDGTIYLQTFANGTENITLIENDTRDTEIIAKAGPKPPHGPDWAAIDDAPPWVRHVWCAEPSRVIVRFSEPVDIASATEPSHYEIDRGVTIKTVETLGPESVALLVSSLDSSSPYSLQIRGVRDASEAKNVIASESAVAFAVGNVSLSDDRFGLAGRATALDQGAETGHGSAAAAFDRNKYTHWFHEGSGGESWLQYEFTGGVRCHVVRYTIHAPSAPPWHLQYEPELFPAAITLQGSNDGSSWTDLDFRPEIQWPAETPSRTFEVSNPGSYSQYRLVIHRSVDPSRDRVLVANFDLFGVVERLDD